MGFSVNFGVLFVGVLVIRAVLGLSRAADCRHIMPISWHKAMYSRYAGLMQGLRWVTSLLQLS